MKTIELIQGSPEWSAHRARHFNASDAPAMMGCGQKTRSELLRELHAGLQREVSSFVQERVFDPGHRFEALARPLAEKIIGEDLYPVTGTSGKYSASFDGLTMLETIAFEHKTLNQELLVVFDDMETMAPEYRDTASAGRLLPLMYQVQMEHQAMVSGCDRILFMASKWDRDDQLVMERHCWYHPDLELRAQIVAGWEQLQADLLTYEPVSVADPEPISKTPETLPALRIEVTGQVTASNLAEFKEIALTAIRGINRELKTDQDFADAEASIKWCSDVESRLAAAKEHALSQTTSIDVLFKTIDDISAEARKVRLGQVKLVDARKDEIRMEIATSGRDAYIEHIKGLNQRIGRPILSSVSRNIPEPDFAGAIKGKRTLSSLRDAVDVELARVKIASNEIADRITLNLRAIESAEHDHLFLDLAGLALKAPDDLDAVIAQRVAKYKQDQEDARNRALRMDEERKAREAAADAAAMQQAAAPVAQAVQDTIEVGTGITRTNSVGVVTRIVPEAVRDTGERIKLGEINARLAPIQITADGLAQLGFAHVATDKSAKLYRESDFPAICTALVNHITAVAEPALA